MFEDKMKNYKLARPLAKSLAKFEGKLRRGSPMDPAVSEPNSESNEEGERGFQVTPIHRLWNKLSKFE